MARFRYRAVAIDGAVSEDVIEAPDRDAAIAKLRQAERLPVTVAVDEDNEPGPRRHGRATRPARAGLFGSGGPSRSARIRFTRELATMIAADVSVDRALEVLAQTATDATLATIAMAMRQRVREGQGLAEAAAAHPSVFSPFYCATLRAGEAGGRLSDALASLARYQERMGHLVTTVQSALIYPTLLAVAALISLVVLLVYVVPQFDQLFREAAAPLPGGTRAVVSVSRFVVDYGWVVLLGGLGIWAYLHLSWRRPAVGMRAHRALLRVPFVGEVIRRMETERFAHTLGALLKNGVLLPDALHLAAEAAANRAVAETIRRSIEAVKGGATLAEALARGAVFPAIAVELLRVGEEGGRLVEMLDRLAATNAVEVETAIKRFVAILEPSLIVVIGVIVGAIILSLVSAIAGINALAF
ncbi:MAG: type II secretion system F family protein [Proteobacteria bacterium]|nr:type II secretion system F family protein [Pseudomonadota bacterium]